MSTADARTGQDIARQLISLVLILGGTVLANILGLAMASTDTGNIANSTFNDTVFFFPATYVFTTIWPVIYLGVVGLAIHQALPSQATNPRYRAGVFMLGINLVLNGAWVAIFGARLFGWSLLAIVPILVTAVIANAWLRAGRSPEAPMAEKVFKIAVSMYTAWLTIATIANAAAALAAAGWDGFGIPYETWAIIISIVGIGLGSALTLLFRDPVFPVVYAYAYVGIVVRQWGQVRPVAITALVGAVVLVAVFVLAAAIKARARKATA